MTKQEQEQEPEYSQHSRLILVNIKQVMFVIASIATVNTLVTNVTRCEVLFYDIF